MAGEEPTRAHTSAHEDCGPGLISGIDVRDYVPELVAEGMSEEDALAFATAVANIVASFVDQAFSPVTTTENSEVG